MGKKAKDAIKEEVKLELTPMIDVTFLILIFFMCTLRFKTLEGKLVSYLPTDKGLSSAKQEVPSEEAEIILKVPVSDRDKPNPLERKIIIYRNGQAAPMGSCLRVLMTDDGRVGGFVQDPPNTLRLVRDYLHGIKERDPEAKAKIHAKPQVPHAYVVHILNMMIEEKFGDISYSGIPNTLREDLLSGKIK